MGIIGGTDGDKKGGGEDGAIFVDDDAIIIDNDASAAGS